MSGDTLQAFLDSGTSFSGKVSFSGIVRIDGHFRGDISADGTLVIGETGVVEATVQVGSLILEGKVVGDVRAKERVELGASAKLEGKLETPRLKIAEGSELMADVKMGEPAASKPPPDSKEP